MAPFQKATLVSAPEPVRVPPPTQLPFIAQHLSTAFAPLESVEVAVVVEILRTPIVSPFIIVEVAIRLFPSMVEVAVPFAEIDNIVVEALFVKIFCQGVVEAPIL